MTELRGLATGIGSLPYAGEDVSRALDQIFKYTPRIPFWPQLPKRNEPDEGMVAQFSEHFPCITFKDGELIYKSSEEELEQFYSRIINNDIEYFKISEKYALGLYAFYDKLENSDLRNIEFIKCQITGPFTFAASIKDDKGSALLHDPVFMQVTIKGLTMKALWQIRFFEHFGKKIIMFMDEPYLSCFGSAFAPIEKEVVIRNLTELGEGIKSGNALTGVHCCGNTDWSIFLDTRAVDIINFDAFSFSERFVLYADKLNDFLRRGGIICWGIVPTQEFTGKETAGLLVARIKASMDILVKKGVDRDLLFKNLLISPACGMATLGLEKSEQILKLLSETSQLIRKILK